MQDFLQNSTNLNKNFEIILKIPKLNNKWRLTDFNSVIFCNKIVF